MHGPQLFNPVKTVVVRRQSDAFRSGEKGIAVEEALHLWLENTSANVG